MKKLSTAVIAVVAVMFVAYAVSARQRGPAEDSRSRVETPGEVNWSAKAEATRATPVAAVLSGSVVEAGSGAPLSDCVVTVTTAAGTPARLRRAGMAGTLAVTRTDAQGHWTMSELPAGRYIVTATALGYLPERSEQLSWSSESDLDLRLELGAGGHQISGVVSDIGGGPIEGAVVRAWVRGSTVSAISDEQGRYALTLPDGEFTLRGWEVDYQPVARSVTVKGHDRVADLKLLPASSILGTVVERGTGEPVAGATVSFYARLRRGGGMTAFRAKKDQWVVTDAQGRFGLQQLGAGEYEVFASADHLASLSPADVAIGIAQQRQGVVVFVDPARNVRGRVVERAQSDTGMGDVTVKAFSITSGSAPVMAVSEPDGSFELLGLVPGTYSLDAVGDGVAPSSQEIAISDVDLDDVVISVDRTALIHGRVEPPQISTVWIEGSDEKRAISDKSGVFELSTGVTGEWTLVAEASDGSHGEVQVQVSQDDLDGVSVTMQPRPALVGRLVDEAGVAIADAEVSLFYDSDAEVGLIPVFPWPVATTTTDGEGGFDLRGLEAGGYHLHAHHRDGDRLVAASAGDDTSGVAVALPEGGVDSLTLVMRRPQGVLAGVVLDPQGGPLADAWVTIDQPDEMDSEREPILTDAEGHFELRHLAEGAYTVYAVSAESDAEAQVELPALRTDLEVELVGFATLSGRVTKDGKPVTQFDVEIGGSTQRGFVDAEGRFSFERIKPGTATVTINAPEGSIIERIEVKPSATVEQTLELGDWATVTGRAVYPDGTPAADVEWSVWSRGWEQDAVGRKSRKLAGIVPKTDASGRFKAQGIGVGGGHVTLRRGPVSSSSSIGSAYFNAEPGATVDIGDVTVLDLEEVASDERGTLELLLTVSSEPPPFTEPDTDAPSKPDRLWVSAIEPGGPAARAGIAVGDEIISIQGYEVESVGAPTVDLLTSSRFLKAGAAYSFVVSRQGATRSVRVEAKPFIQ